MRLERRRRAAPLPPFSTHAYAVELDPAKIERVARAWLDAQGALTADLDGFEAFLEALALELELEGPG